MRRHTLFLSLILLILRPVSVFAQRIAEIQIAPPFMRMVQDAQAQFVATVYDADGAPVNTRIRWTSSNINIATVDSAGVVKAIWPGSVVVTALVESEGRRIVARAAVNILRPRENRPPTVVGFPGAPGVPPGRPPNYVYVQTDSMLRASINCAEPFLNAANPMRACYDARAVMRDSTGVPAHPVPDKCGQDLEHAMLLVQVTETGAVEHVLPLSMAQCGDYAQAVVDWGRRLTFTPAQKDGHPVRSWVRIMLRDR
jgi:hypothetical protein